MKRLRLDRWAVQLQPPRNPRLRLHQQRCPYSHETRAGPRRQLQQRQDQAQHPWQCQRRNVASRRKASSAAAAQVEEADEDHTPFMPYQSEAPVQPPEAFLFQPSDLSDQPNTLNAPSPSQALRSAKLSALHARLSLPPQLPLQTLARCLIDSSVDPRPGYNNAPLALIGQDILGQYTAEWLLCHYPRLPMPVLFAAQYAYVGAATLAAMRGEWGVEVVAAPGPEVDAGLLQLKRRVAGNALSPDGDGGKVMRMKQMPQARRLGSGRKNEEWDYRRGMSSRIVYDDQFGELQTGLASAADAPPYPGAPMATLEPDSESPTPPSPSESSVSTTGMTLETASANFIRALAGALHLHCSPSATKDFHTQHIISRHLPLHTLFHFTHPTRDVSRLCAREGFEPPVARLISETGRLSRTPVFVVGVFSGDDKLGEGAGASLNEGRVRAAAAALRSWYLYSPPEAEVVLPSEVEGGSRKNGSGKEWRSQTIDIGEIVT